MRAGASLAWILGRVLCGPAGFLGDKGGFMVGFKEINFISFEYHFLP